MSLPATLNASDPQKRAAVKKCLKDAQFKAQTRQLRPDTLNNFLRNYDSQLRRDGFTSPELQKLTPALRTALEDCILKQAGLVGPGMQGAPSDVERCVQMLELKYKQQRVTFTELAPIFDDIQRWARHDGLIAGDVCAVCNEAEDLFTRRAADTEIAELPHALPALVERWMQRRNQLGKLSERPHVLLLADSRLAAGALERLKSAPAGSITPLNIAEQWQAQSAKLRSLPEATRQRAKSLIFWRLLNAAAPNADSDLWWLTSLIFGEVGDDSEPWNAKLAVGWVVRNRVTVNKNWNNVHFAGTVKAVISQPGEFDGYDPFPKWKRAMAYHADAEIHKNSAFKKADLSDADRDQLLESLRAAFLVMEHPGSNPDPTIGGLDKVGATFFADAITERYKSSEEPIAPYDLKDNGGLGSHMFWDRSLEWWLGDKLSRGVGTKTIVPTACFVILPSMERGAEASEEQRDEVLREGLEELRMLRNTPASIR